MALMGATGPNSILRSATCLALVLGAIACSGQAPTSPSLPIPTESLTMRVQTAHFQVFAGPTTPDATVRSAGDRLDAELSLIHI